MIKHIVLFKRKADYDKAAFEEMMTGFRSISGKISCVRNLTIGDDISHRGSFDLALCCDFDNEADLRTYGQHPEHQRLIHEVLPKAVEDKREVIDYPY